MAEMPSAFARAVDLRFDSKDVPRAYPIRPMHAEMYAIPFSYDRRVSLRDGEIDLYGIDVLQGSDARLARYVTSLTYVPQPHDAIKGRSDFCLLNLRFHQSGVGPSCVQLIQRNVVFLLADGVGSTQCALAVFLVLSELHLVLHPFELRLQFCVVYLHQQIALLHSASFFEEDAHDFSRRFAPQLDFLICNDRSGRN